MVDQKKFLYLFFPSFILYLIYSFLKTTMFITIIPQILFDFIKYISLILIILYFYSYSIEKRKIPLVIILGFLIFLSSIFSSYNNLLIIFLFIIAAKNIDYSKINKCYFITSSILLVITILCSLLGIIDNLVYVKDGINRYSFGGTYTTDFAAHVFYIILSFCVYKKGKLNIFNYLIIFIISILLYFFCYTRLDAGCIIILLILNFLYNKKILNFNSLVLKKILPYSFPVLGIIIILLTVNFNYKNPMYDSIDHLLSGRLTIGKMALNKYNIELFGQKIDEIGLGYSTNKLKGDYNYIDCSYIRILIINGLAVYIIVNVCNIIIMKKLYKEKAYYILLIYLLIFINSLIAQHFLDFSYNFSIICYLCSFNKFEEVDYEKI